MPMHSTQHSAKRSANSGRRFIPMHIRNSATSSSAMNTALYRYSAVNSYISDKPPEVFRHRHAVFLAPRVRNFKLVAAHDGGELVY